MDKGVYRIIDANLNRVMEGIRVSEDIIRFSSKNEKLTFKLKTLRHDIFNAIKDLRKEYLEELVSSRDLNDVGIKSSESEKTRDNLVDLFLANAQRGKESLRVLEEVLKLFDQKLSQKFKKFRFRLYEIEKAAVEDLEKIFGNK
jgi:hydroxymethylpyrimidine phosphate kinase ThiD-like protein